MIFFYQAKLAMEQQVAGNKAVAAILRDQADVIKKQKELDAEIRRIQNQDIVASVLSEKYKPQEAVEKVLITRIEEGIVLI